MGKVKIYDMKAISNDEYENFVRSEAEEWRQYAKSTIEKVEEIESPQIQLLCYFSLMECLAQDVANYPNKGQHKAFTDFVLKYQNKYCYLDEIDPVTLFYHTEKNVGEVFDLSDFQDGAIYYPTDSFIQKQVKILVTKLTETIGEEAAIKLAQKHRYVDLLYRMRCRLSHEFSQSYIGHMKHQESPYYISCSRTYIKDKKVIEDDVWHFCIPVEFVKSICVNCIDNYLNECIVNNVLPVDNNSMDRFCELSWYQ